MAQDATVKLSESSWTELTNADATNATFQITGGPALLKRSTGTAPSDNTGAFQYQSGQGEVNAVLAELFPGASGSRLWAKALSGHSQAAISHA